MHLASKVFVTGCFMSPILRILCMPAALPANADGDRNGRSADLGANPGGGAFLRHALACLTLHGISASNFWGDCKFFTFLSLPKRLLVHCHTETFVPSHLESDGRYRNVLPPVAVWQEEGKHHTTSKYLFPWLPEREVQQCTSPAEKKALADTQNSHFFVFW